MAWTSPKTKAQIIAFGLELGDNTELYDSSDDSGLASTFFDLYLDAVYAGWDWPRLQREETISIAGGAQAFLTSTLSPPSSGAYRKLASIHLDDEAMELAEWKGSFTEFRRKIKNAVSSGETGKPLYFKVDPDSSTNKIWLYPIADKSYSGTIWYYYQPAALDKDDLPLIPAALALANTIADFAKHFEREGGMLGVIDRNMAGTIEAGRRGMSDTGKQSARQISLDKTVHQWRRQD